MANSLILNSGSVAAISANPVPVAQVVAGTPPLVWQMPVSFEDAEFSIFGDVEVDAQDRIYISDDWNGIWVLNAEGQVESLIPRNLELLDYSNMAVLPDGTLWLVNWFDNQIVHLDQQGQILARVGGEGTGPGQFNTFSPTQIESDSEGNLYVLDSDDFAPRGRVQVFNASGEFLREFNISMPSEDSFVTDVYLAVDNGYVFVADPDYGLRAFSAEGQLIIDYSLDVLSLTRITGLAVRPATHTIYVLSADGIFLELDWNFSIVSRYEGALNSEKSPFDSGEFYAPLSAAFLSDGDVVLIDMETSESYGQIVRMRLPEAAISLADAPDHISPVQPSETTGVAANPTLVSNPVVSNSSQTANCPFTPRLRIGETGQVIDDAPNKLRSEPAVSGTLLEMAYTNEVFLVLNGSICDDELVWWKVRTNVYGIEGWTAEGDTSEYWLEPFSCPGAPCRVLVRAVLNMVDT